MQINSELCHVDERKIIVRITISENQVIVTSALGQGEDVNAAENNALQKAISRINVSLDEFETPDRINDLPLKLDPVAIPTQSLESGGLVVLLKGIFP